MTVDSVEIMADSEIQKWLKNVEGWLVESWGLSSNFAASVSLLLAYFFLYRLSPSVTSGYRSLDKQKELQTQYEAGNKSVIVKPAVDSLHTRTSWGRPAAEAIDISTSNSDLAARIATAIGVGAGYYFRTPDRVHFYNKAVR